MLGTQAVPKISGTREVAEQYVIVFSASPETFALKQRFHSPATEYFSCEQFAACSPEHFSRRSAVLDIANSIAKITNPAVAAATRRADP